MYGAAAAAAAVGWTSAAVGTGKKDRRMFSLFSLALMALPWKVLLRRARMVLRASSSESMVMNQVSPTSLRMALIGANPSPVNTSRIFWEGVGESRVIVNRRAW